MAVPGEPGIVPTELPRHVAIIMVTLPASKRSGSFSATRFGAVSRS